MREQQRQRPPQRLRSQHDCLLLLLLLTIISSISSAKHYLIQHDIRRRQTQCIYNRFDRGDFATFSTFIVDSSDENVLSAAVQVEGPVGDPRLTLNVDDETGGDKDDKFGTRLQKQIEEWPRFLKDNHRHFQHAGIIHHAFNLDYTFSGESEDAIVARAQFTLQKKMDEMKRLEEMVHKKRGMLERKQKEGQSLTEDIIEKEIYEEESGKMTHIIPEKIEPYEWTKPIKGAGWYRLCVQAPANAMITVEMDIRSSADLGGVDSETGHVYTHAHREYLEEEERILAFQNAIPEKEAEPSAEELEFQKELKDQIHVSDLKTTAKQLSEIHSLTTQIMNDQAAAHHRIKGHENDAQRNHGRIVKSGIMETVMYILITGYQVYTVHKWLLSNSLLGR